MTSLDFQSLLKQEKALLRQAERLKQSATSTASAASTDNAAQPEKATMRSSHKHQSDQEKAGGGGGGGKGAPVSDGEVHSSDHPLSSPNGSPAEGCGSEEPVDPENCPLRREPSPSCFAELASRPSLDPLKMRVGATPTIFYVPDFISEAEEEHIMARTYSSAPSASTVTQTQTQTQHTQQSGADAGADSWVTLSSRRLKCWGGQPGEGFEPEPLPGWVEALRDALVRRKVFTSEGRPNHVLLNEYKPGQGIMPHTDGPFYAPRTATLSVGSDAIMHFSPRVAAADIGRPGVDARPQSSLVLKRRCLVVFADEAYSRLLHGIDAVTEETVGARGAPVVNAAAAGAPEGTVVRRQLRVSLTFRRFAPVEPPATCDDA